MHRWQHAALAFISKQVHLLKIAHTVNGTDPYMAMGYLHIGPQQIKSNQILLVTYTWLADVNESVAKCLCF